MSQYANERFEYTYARNAAESYLVVTTDAREKVRDYQLEMIANNRIQYILPLDARRRDDRISFYCTITSLLPLSQFLRKRKLCRDEFTGILLDTARALLDCRNYLLKDRCFILKEDFIYINPATLDISMLYIPVEPAPDIGARYRELVVSLIMYSADLDEDSDDNFLQKILGFVKSDTFSVGGFSRLLNSLSGVGIPQYEEAGCQAQEAVQDKDVPEGRPAGHAKDTARERQSRRNIQPARYIGKKPVIAAVLVQAAIAVLIALNRKRLEGLGGNTAVTYAAVIVIVLALDLLLFKTLFKEGAVRIQRGGTAASGKIQGAVPDDRPAASPYPAEETLEDLAGTKSGDIDASILDLKGQMRGKDMVGRNVGPSGERRNETVFLAQAGDPYPYLLGDCGGTAGKVSVMKPDFTIGRLEGQVDFVCKSRAVGKVHARIITREGRCFLVDVNSKNGTFINDVKIDSNREYPIANNDRIVFANSCYTFIVPGNIVPGTGHAAGGHALGGHAADGHAADGQIGDRQAAGAAPKNSDQEN